MKKYVFILLLTFLLPLSVSANEINDLDIKVNVLDNGDARITETWVIKSNKNTEMYHSYDTSNISKSRFKDLYVTMDGKPFSTISNWNVDGTFNEKKYKAGINYASGQTEMCWGISEYGLHTYVVSYTITNYVKQLNDYQVIFWTMVAPMDFKRDKTSIEVTMNGKPFPESSLVWGYGWKGKAALENGKGVFSSDGLSASNSMIILIQVPLGTFNATDAIDMSFEELFATAEQGVSYKGDFIDSILSVFGFIINNIVYFLMFIFIIGGSYFFSKKKKGNFQPIRKMKAKKDIPYFRDIPCNKDINYAYFIGSKFNIINEQSGILGAILLKWINEDKIKVEKVKEGLIIKKDRCRFDLSTDFATDNENESELKGLLLLAAGDDKYLDSKEFERFSKNNYELIIKWIDNCLEYEEKELEAKQLITKRKAIIGYVSIMNEEMVQEAEKLQGLKKFLLDFSLINEKEALEVKLWDEYLIFATLLNIADKVKEQFIKVYPQYETYSKVDMDTIVMVNLFSSSTVHAATSAEFESRMNSGGGGSSSIGGGGGSFGGGSFSGGGGGFR